MDYKISQNIKLLYVENDENMRNTLSKLLKPIIKKLEFASHAEEGLAKYKSFKPDIIVSSLSMPSMSALELARTIRKKNSSIPILIALLKEESDVLLETIDVGISGYIMKPIDEDRLLNTIRAFSKPIILEKELNKKDEQLVIQSKMVAMGEMIGNIAHQWRQPLSVISTGATGMKMKKEYGILEDKDFYQICDAIDENAQYLSQTIDDFRNFIKGDNKPIRFDLKNDTDSFIKLVDSTIKKYHIQIILNLKENINVKGYPNELIQCFINIFNNSKDALIENNKEDERYIFISQVVKNNRVTIEFKDNAGGIPQDIIEKIFEPYFTTKHQSQGTGLGLHMSYNLIVNGMNGIIHANNEEFEFDNKNYKGAKFTISIPLNKQDEE